MYARCVDGSSRLANVLQCDVVCRNVMQYVAVRCTFSLMLDVTIYIYMYIYVYTYIYVYM